MSRWQDRAADFYDGLAGDPTLDTARRMQLNYAAMTLRKDGDFDEAKHPRAPDGKFGEGTAEAQKEIQEASAGYGAGSKEHNAALAKHGLKPTHMRTVGSATKLPSGMAATWKVGELDPQTFVGRIGKIKDASGQVKPVLLTGVAGKEHGEGHFHFSEDLTGKTAPPSASAGTPRGPATQPSESVVPRPTTASAKVHGVAAQHTSESEGHRSAAQSLAASARSAGQDGKAKSTKVTIGELRKAADAAEKAHRSAVAAFTADPQNKDLYRAQNQRDREQDDLLSEIHRLEDSQLGPSRKNEFGEWTRKPK